jgi:50S ribosomal subunit-associated GTPase HflX
VTIHRVETRNDRFSLCIADIPTTLIEAFRATLNDAIDAHLLIHVCDISHPDHVVQTKVVLQTLHELNVPATKLQSMITVYNKADLLDQPRSENLPIIDDAEDDDEEDETVATDSSLSDTDLKREDGLYISCKTRRGLDQLVAVIQDKLMVASDRVVYEYRVLQGGELYQLLAQGAHCTIEKMLVDEKDPQFIRLKCLFSRAAYAKFQARYVGAAKYQLRTDS